MRYIKQTLTAVLAVLLALPTLAQDFQYEGIWYTVIDPDAKTCKTKDGVPTEWGYKAGNTCEGDLVIPAEVSDGTNNYTVVGIGTYGFFDCNVLTSISVPSTLTSIGNYAFSACI